MSSTRKNAIYNIAYRVFSIFLPLVTAPYLSRTVGQAGVGLYSYAWSVSYIFCLVAMLGLSDYGVRVISRASDDQAELNRAFSSVYRMQVLVAGTVLLVWLGYVFLIAGEEKPIALALTLMSVSCLINPDWVLMGLNEFRSIAVRSTAVKLLAAAATFLFVKKPEDLWIYGLVWSAATFAGCVLCWVPLKGRVSFVPVTMKEILVHLKPCAVLSISVLAVSVYRQMDKVMLGAMSGMAENGLYENAEKIIYCLSGFISAIGTVMMPRAARLLKVGDTEAVKQRMTHTMELILCMTGAMAFGLTAVAAEFAPLFYGKDFAYSGVLMIPLGFTLMMIGFANVIRTQWVIPGGHDHIFVRSVLTGAGVNLAANLLLIPRFGAMGAVAATLLAEFSVPLVQWLHLRKLLPYGAFLRLTAEYCIPGLLMLAFVRLLARLPLTGWTAVAVQAIGGAACYAVLCLVFWLKAGRRHMLKLLKLKR